MTENIALNAGEQYAGVILGASAAPSHHLILLPGVLSPDTWAASAAWANIQGGSLPDRSEQSLLFANLRDAFEYAGYWSSELSEHIDRAWAQIFRLGGQYCDNVDNALHAVAVRRVPVRGNHEPQPVDHIHDAAEIAKADQVVINELTKVSNWMLHLDVPTAGATAQMMRIKRVIDAMQSPSITAADAKPIASHLSDVQIEKIHSDVMKN